MNLIFWTSVIMFTRVYWFMCTTTIYTVGIIGSGIIKKITRDKRNALGAPQGQDDPPAQDGIQTVD